MSSSAIRPAVAMAVGWAAAMGVVVWRGGGEVALWSVVAGGFGAGVIAGVIALMQESVIEDVVKAAMFTILGLTLGGLGVPGWMSWPFLVGPWTGFLANRGRRA